MKKAGQPRDMDNLFHTRLAQLESNMGNMKNEIQLAVSDVLEGELNMRKREKQDAAGG